MNDNEIKKLEQKFKTFVLPYQLGVYLAVNAVKDAVLLVDGPNCSIPKAEFIYGNHDINSTLFSPNGMHRLFYTMSHPLQQRGNPEDRLRAMLSLLARCGSYGAVLITGLPFQALAGMDYDGLTSAMEEPVPVFSVPAKSLEGDWLLGYACALESFASALYLSDREKKKNSVAIAGYFFDRNEGDHFGNICELKRLLSLCGLDLVCVFPNGGTFSELGRVFEAEYIISFPYGRKAAEIISKKSGAKLINSRFPLGYGNTTEWIREICSSIGINLPEIILEEEIASKKQYLKIGSILRHKPVFYAGDPYLGEALFSFLHEIGMRPDTFVIDCQPQKLNYMPKRILFSPVTERVVNMISSLKGFEKPKVLIGNSFAWSEAFAADIPFIELGFPSYSHHCFTDEPFLGYKGAMNIIAKLLNSQMKT